MAQILCCQNCGEYTLAKTCKCKGKAIPILPPKFSLLDKYASYRRQAKLPEQKQKGLV